MAVKEWDPGGIIAWYGAFRLEGFAPGTFIKGERFEDTYKPLRGVDGEHTRERSRNRGGRLTLTLLQSSASNLVLSGLVTADEFVANGLPPLPLIVKTTVGVSLFFAAQAWIVRPTDQEYADSLTNRVWMFDSGDVSMTDGGLTPLSGQVDFLRAQSPF